MASHLLDQEKRYSFRQAAQQSIPDYYFFNVSLVSKATEVRMFPEILSDLKIFWTPHGPDLGHIQYWKLLGLSGLRENKDGGILNTVDTYETNFSENRFW